MKEKNSNSYTVISSILDDMLSHPETVTEHDRDMLRSLYNKFCKASYISEKSAWVCHWVIEKFKSKSDKVPYAVEDFGQNVITNVGAAEMLKLICGQSAYPYDSANATITVGNNGTAENANQIGVLAEKEFQSTAYVDSGYPRVDGNSMMFAASFDENAANFQWRELSIGNGRAAMNRKVLSNPRIKSGDLWIVRCTITIEQQ